MPSWILVSINNTFVLTMIYLFFLFSPCGLAAVFVVVGSRESTILQGGYKINSITLNYS